MRRKNRLTLILILSIIMLMTSFDPCYGNSAEPPSILIIVPGAPEGLEISIDSDNTSVKASMRDKTYVYPKMYSWDIGE